MQRKTKKIVLALVVIGVVAAGGAAFTAANTVPTHAVGYGQPSSPARSPARSITRSRLMACTSPDGDDAHRQPADAPVVTAGFGGNGVALQACTATAATGNFGAATAPRSPRAPTAPAYVTVDRDQFNVAVTGVTP